MIDAFFRSPAHAMAVLDEHETEAVSYGRLRALVEECRIDLAILPRPALLMQLTPNGLGGIVCYLAALASRLPLIMADAQSSATSNIIKVYRPTALFCAKSDTIPEGYRIDKMLVGGRIALCIKDPVKSYEIVPHPDLALLLTTSGSTGNPKIVRLTIANLLANAESIATYLGLCPGEISIQSLPMHYSYGLSLVNSHLFAGGTVAQTNRSFMRPEFWAFFDQAGCTSFAGVPYMYETLQRLRINPVERKSLRTMTQAGGHLRPEIVKHFAEAAVKADKAMVVMYGATEATARISYVPKDKLLEKLGTIGVAIPKGNLSLKIVGDSGMKELIYEGPNVMLGYAEKPEDLALGDVQNGRYATGDLAEVDDDGFYRITGRLARFAKLFGKRVYLGDIETKLESAFGHSAAAIEGPNSLKIYLEGASEQTVSEGRSLIAALLSVPPSAIQGKSLLSIPKTPSGKKDYKALT
ncbi:MAG: AMP-binding protein [Opitutaceae bacterium]|jgi:acyl-CoA synthetase (AMP-forming)/AMP-acid ligase II